MDVKFRFSFAETYIFIMSLVGSWVVGKYIGTVIRKAHEYDIADAKEIADANTGE